MKKVIFNILVAIVAIPSGIAWILGLILFLAGLVNDSLHPLVGIMTGGYLLFGASATLMVTMFMHELFSKSFDQACHTTPQGV